VLEIDLAAVREDDRALDGAGELANVAGERILH
jgi:hypothetical protein